MQQQQPEPSAMERMQNTANLIYLVAKSVVVMAEVGFLRKGFGPRYLGLHAFLAIPLLMLYTLGWPGHDMRPLLAYMLLYLFMCLVARVNMVLRQGHPGHSRYDGFPRLARLFPRLDEVTIKRAVEPSAVFLIAVAILPLNEPLGGYMLLTALALFITAHTTAASEHARAMDMRDLFIEQQQAADRFRATQGNRSLIYERKPP